MAIDSFLEVREEFFLIASEEEKTTYLTLMENDMSKEAVQFVIKIVKKNMEGR